MSTILDRLKEKYKHLEKYGMFLAGIYYCGEEEKKGKVFSFTLSEGVDDYQEGTDKKNYSISLNHPFIFDNRLVPKEFEGIKVLNVISGDFPEEFDVDEDDDFIPNEEYFAPEKYIQFVDRCYEEVKIKLDSPEMTKEEMLDALMFEGDFLKHVQKTEERRLKRIIGN